MEHENRGKELMAFVNNPQFADCVLIVGKEMRLFYVHKVVLAAVSPFFYTMFTSGMKVK